MSYRLPTNINPSTGCSIPDDSPRCTGGDRSIRIPDSILNNLSDEQLEELKQSPDYAQLVGDWVPSDHNDDVPTALVHPFLTDFAPQTAVEWYRAEGERRNIALFSIVPPAPPAPPAPPLKSQKSGGKKRGRQSPLLARKCRSPSRDKRKSRLPPSKPARKGRLSTPDASTHRLQILPLLNHGPAPLSRKRKDDPEDYEKDSSRICSRRQPPSNGQRSVPEAGETVSSPALPPPQVQPTGSDALGSQSNEAVPSIALGEPSLSSTQEDDLDYPGQGLGDDPTSSFMTRGADGRHASHGRRNPGQSTILDLGPPIRRSSRLSVTMNDGDASSADPKSTSHEEVLARALQENCNRQGKPMKPFTKDSSNPLQDAANNLRQDRQSSQNWEFEQHATSRRDSSRRLVSDLSSQESAYLDTPLARKMLKQVLSLDGELPEDPKSPKSPESSQVLKKPQKSKDPRDNATTPKSSKEDGAARLAATRAELAIKAAASIKEGVGKSSIGHQVDDVSNVIPSPLPVAQPIISVAPTPKVQLLASHLQNLPVEQSPDPPVTVSVTLPAFHYPGVVPEILPNNFTRVRAGNAPVGFNALTGTVASRKFFSPKLFKVSSKAPPVCSLSTRLAQGWPETFTVDVLEPVTKYLSQEEVRTLRLVSKAISNVVTPILFRNVVAKFGKAMFDMSLINWNDKTGTRAQQCFTEKYGAEINKFGITFEVDLAGLFYAKPKVLEVTKESFWGSYKWVVPEYPRFPELKSLEDLCDDNGALLNNMLRRMVDVSELGISVDSGHGWLNGPDLSDMEIYEMRGSGGRVFGKTFNAEDRWQEHVLDEFFQWAQKCTVNESLKAQVAGRQANSSNSRRRTGDITFLNSVDIRSLKSFEDQAKQHDYDANKAHTGGTEKPRRTGPLAGRNLPNLGANLLNLHPWALTANNGAMSLAQLQNGPVATQTIPAVSLNQGMFPGQILPNVPHNFQGPLLPGQMKERRPLTTPKKRSKKAEKPKVMPQWPIIFNGHSLSAHIGGNLSYIQEKVFNPANFPLKPGHLTEAQAQWLMETVWAQRAFLGIYTTSIIENQDILKGIHSLHIAKLSSGLLESLEQPEFWKALPNLKALKLLVSPDWRTEHVIGDRTFQNNMLISPVDASVKVAKFLQKNILPLERMSNLTIGFVGGGEHATGIFARNQHVLPVPVTLDPRQWLTDHITTPDPSTMLRFDHIKELHFENCWFSPCMLNGFMDQTHDTSLRHLTLDSVSLTAAHSTSSTASLSNEDGALEPLYGVNAWLQEGLPTTTCWAAVLDGVTPGVTFLEQKYQQRLINSKTHPMPEKSFRGGVEKITLKSCGYAVISGVTATEFNQNEVQISLLSKPMDEGLRERMIALRAGQPTEQPSRRRNTAAAAAAGIVAPNAPFFSADIRISDSSPSSPAKVMMSSDYFGLGTLTQVVHPIEKRVLEQAWGMKFGWVNDMKRWAAVEDGCFEGGTGRFSGAISKN